MLHINSENVARENSINVWAYYFCNDSSYYSLVYIETSISR